MQRRDVIRTLLAAGASTAGITSAAHAEESSAKERPPRKRAVRFAHFTDTHVYAQRNAPQGLASALKHLHAQPDRPDFILNGGDAVYDALEESRDAAVAQWKLWTDLWKEHATLPVRHVLGNHDIWGWNKAQSKTTGNEADWGKTLALHHLGLERSYDRFDTAGWRFLILDSITFDEQTAYRAQLDPQQFAWLAAELQATPPQMPVVVVSHIPILTVGTVGFTTELRKHPEASKMLSHQDAFEILQLFQKHPNVKLCLSGHTHLTEKVSWGGIDFINSGAVSGLWWKGNFLHTPAGYNLIDLYDDGTCATTYTPYGWPAKT